MRLTAMRSSKMSIHALVGEHISHEVPVAMSHALASAQHMFHCHHCISSHQNLYHRGFPQGSFACP